MSVVERVRYREVVDTICRLDWTAMTAEEMTGVAWAYYYFSVQFRESLKAARALYPDDVKLIRLEEEECDTDNLSPWPGVALPGERMTHDEYMRRTLELTPIDADKVTQYTAIGTAYLEVTRSLDMQTCAAGIASYEDGGLESVFRSILEFAGWDSSLLRSFRHFLIEHVRFDSDPDQGHGALSRHIEVDDRVLPLWEGFHALFVSCVPRLAG